MQEHKHISSKETVLWRQMASYFHHAVWRTLFLVAAGVLFAVTLGSLVHLEAVEVLKQRVAVPLQVLYAELLGFIAPGPRYILYPILIKLRDFGVSSGVIIALISGHVLIEPSTVQVEAGFFGIRFPIKRFAVSLVVTFLAGMLAASLEGWI